MDISILYVLVVLGVALLGVIGVQYAKKQKWINYIDQFHNVSIIGFYILKRMGVIKSKNGKLILELAEDALDYVQKLSHEVDKENIKQIAYDYAINEINKLKLEINEEDTELMKQLINEGVDLLVK